MTMVTVYEWSDDLAVEHGPVAGRVDLAAATRYEDLWDEDHQCSRATGLRDYRQTVYLTDELGPVQHCWSEDPADEKYVTMERRDAFRWLVSQGYGDTARAVFIEWATYEDAELVALRIVRAVLTEFNSPATYDPEAAAVKLHRYMYDLLDEHGLTGVENLIDVLARYVIMGLNEMRKNDNHASTEAVLVENEFYQLVHNNLQHLS